jgi:hypothetical protein
MDTMIQTSSSLSILTDRLAIVTITNRRRRRRSVEQIIEHDTIIVSGHRHSKMFDDDESQVVAHHHRQDHVRRRHHHRHRRRRLVHLIRQHRHQRPNLTRAIRRRHDLGHHLIIIVPMVNIVTSHVQIIRNNSINMMMKINGLVLMNVLLPFFNSNKQHYRCR